MKRDILFDTFRGILVSITFDCLCGKMSYFIYHVFGFYCTAKGLLFHPFKICALPENLLHKLIIARMSLNYYLRHGLFYLNIVWTARMLSLKLLGYNNIVHISITLSNTYLIVIQNNLRSEKTIFTNYIHTNNEKILKHKKIIM